MAARRPIAVLPDAVAERIAAGEVVERPASVVRELLDNAIDAGATEVSVDVRGSGLELIRVADDGHGIPPDEVELAFLHHATSKLADVDDLQTLQTLGFRGEALPSIAAVAEVEMLTRDEPSESATSVVVRAGSVTRHRRAARQRGTTVTVRHLFGNVPARRKFTPEGRAEFVVVGQIVRRYALAHPGVRFTLTLDGRLSFRSTGDGRLEAAIADVYGQATAASLIPVHIAPDEGFTTRGFVTGRAITRPGRDHLTLIVNGRWVASRTLTAALESAYRPFLPRGRHPIAVIAIDVPPHELDPNVHPAKTEIRLLREPTVATAIAAAVRATYERTPARMANDDLALDAVQYRLTLPNRRLADGRAAYSGRFPDDNSGLPDLTAARIVGQLQETLILVETEDGLLLVDQHRAHERVIYDRLDAADGEHPEAQALLEPVVLELKQHEAALLEERLAGLQSLGLTCEQIGGRAFLIRSVPAIPGDQGLLGHLQEVLEDAASGQDNWRDRLLVSVACRAALRRSRALTAHEMATLVRDLARTTAPAVCPHGSPLILQVGSRYLEKQFRW